MKEGFFKDKKKRSIFISLTSVGAVLLTVLIVCIVYVNVYYHADDKAIAAFEPQSGQTVTCERKSNGDIVYKPENAEVGMIFYPGGKVEHDAYMPLMEACAAKGILCVLVEMPFRLAVFDINAADGIQKQYPEIEDWYIGGHSLGGSMAASYLADHQKSFEGLILLGSYSTEDFSKSDIDVLSVYGSRDKVLDHKKYEKNRKNLPADFEEYVIEGGCHAYFGMYGAQDGDGKPLISNTEQIYITADYIAAFVA